VILYKHSSQTLIQFKDDFLSEEIQGFKSLPLHIFYFTRKDFGENALNVIVANKRDLNRSILK